MKYPRKSAATFILWFAFSTLGLQADITIRYKNDFKLGALPPGMGATLQQVQSVVPQFRLIQVKGNKAFSSNGNLLTFSDFGTQEITLVDAAGKRFATMPMKDFADSLGSVIPARPDQAQAMQGMTPHYSSRKTGRSENILGVQAEETEMIFTLDVAEAGGPLPAGPFLKQVIRVWTAKDEEALRVPAVRQWAGYSAYSNLFMDPLASMKKIFANLPGFGQAVSVMAEQVTRGLLLRSRFELYMPAMLALQQADTSSDRPAIDPNAPLMEMNSEIVELSTNPIEDSVFQLPGDYQSAAVADILKAQVSSIAQPAASAPTVPTPQRIRVGGNVQANSLISKINPVYPPLAKQAGIEGTVRFTVVIDREGNVAHLQLVSGHPLLVEPAQDAVRQWQYRPTLLNGQPVEVVTQVDINFTLQLSH